MRERLRDVGPFLTLAGFFLPWVKNLFAIQVPLGGALFVTLLLWSWTTRDRRQDAKQSAPAMPDAPQTPKRKSILIELPQEKLLYSFEYPTDHEDIASSIQEHWPRCLVHRIPMEPRRQRFDHHGIKTQYVCDACGHVLSVEENRRFMAIAKAEALRRIG